MDPLPSRFTQSAPQSAVSFASSSPVEEPKPRRSAPSPSPEPALPRPAMSAYPTPAPAPVGTGTTAACSTARRRWPRHRRLSRWRCHLLRPWPRRHRLHRCRYHHGSRPRQRRGPLLYRLRRPDRSRQHLRRNRYRPPRRHHARCLLLPRSRLWHQRGCLGRPSRHPRLGRPVRLPRLGRPRRLPRHSRSSEMHLRHHVHVSLSRAPIQRRSACSRRYAAAARPLRFARPGARGGLLIMTCRRSSSTG